VVEAMKRSQLLRRMKFNDTLASLSVHPSRFKAVYKPAFAMFNLFVLRLYKNG
jgi:hypothetical protein